MFYIMISVLIMFRRCSVFQPKYTHSSKNSLNHKFILFTVYLFNRHLVVSKIVEERFLWHRALCLFTYFYLRMTTRHQQTFRLSVNLPRNQYFFFCAVLRCVLRFNIRKARIAETCFRKKLHAQGVRFFFKYGRRGEGACVCTFYIFFFFCMHKDEQA